jgi:predicted nucleic-acid-binding Zn-ribbon protein
MTIMEFKESRQKREISNQKKKGRNMNEIEMKCLRCGSQNVKPSCVESTGRIYSRPKEATIMAIFKTGAHIRALTCLDCGHVELFVDTEKAKALVKSA